MVFAAAASAPSRPAPSPHTVAEKHFSFDIAPHLFLCTRDIFDLTERDRLPYSTSHAVSIVLLGSGYYSKANARALAVPSSIPMRSRLST